MNRVDEICNEQRNEFNNFNSSDNETHFHFYDPHSFDIEANEPPSNSTLENTEQSHRSIPNIEAASSKTIAFCQKLQRIKSNIYTCLQVTGNFIYHNKFISLVSIELILMFLKLFQAISQSTETILSLCLLSIFIIMGLISFAILIRRENERIRRFSITHNEFDHERNHTTVRIDLNNPHNGESPDLRVQQIRTQIQNLGQLFNQMNNQIRAQRMLMAVQLLAQNHGDEPIIFPDQSQATFGEIVFSQDFFNLIAGASIQGNNHQQQQGMTQEQINSFPSSFYNQDNDEAPEICSICLEEFRNGSEIRNLLCKHVFHQSCIDEWLRQRNNCPNCKKTFEFSDNNIRTNNTNEEN